MPTDEQIVSWKSGAWQDAGAVAAYVRRFAEPSGPTLLRAALEKSLIERYALPGKVLDVGIGTGRAALTLAPDRYALTGLDNSPAMLKKCRELAGSASLELVLADLATVPFAPGSFDTVLSIDTLIHFPNWRELLPEWQRVTVPGGRILFDCGSKDHDPHGELADPSVVGFSLGLHLAEICDFATASGLRVIDAIPYGVLAGSAARNRFFAGTLMSGHAYDRLLSWAAGDAKFLQFLLLLEQELFANFSTAASSRMFVVLQNEADAAANAALVLRNEQIASTLRAGFNTLAAAAIGIDAHRIARELEAHLDHEPNRFALYRLLCANLRWNWPVTVPDFIDARWLPEASSILQKATVDRDFTGFLSTFHNTAPLEDALAYRGVDLGEVWETDLMIGLLEGVVRAFDE